MSEFEKLGKRVKFCLAKTGGYDSMSNMTGIPVRTLTNYASGKNDLKNSALVLIAKAANVSVEWMATGFGFPAIEENSLAFESIPMVNVLGSASSNEVVYEDRTQEFLKLSYPWISKSGSFPNDLFLMPVIDEAMEPTLYSGDVLLCSKSEQHKKIGDGIYVIRLDGNILVKRTQLLPAKKLKISSDNSSQFTSFEIDLEAGSGFEVVGKVVYRLSKKF